jgi:drug/metabolite transporter (DMT)-like permease
MEKSNQSKSSKGFRANFLLLITAVIWGGGFVAQRLGMQELGPYIFNGFRFLVGALTLVPIIVIRKKRNPGDNADFKKTLFIGSAAGLFLFFGATFQQLGLVYTTAGKAGFVTGLYVIIVPLLGMIWGDRAPVQTWLGAIFAVIGLYFLSATQGLKLDPGDSYVLLGAFFWAGHVQFIARFSPRVDPIRLSFVQALFTSLISFGIGFFVEEFQLQQILAVAIPILYGGVISIGLAYTLQVIAQQDAKPAHAAILLSLESVFAVFWGWLLIGEVLTPRALFGSFLMLGGMMISQVLGKKVN